MSSTIDNLSGIINIQNSELSYIRSNSFPSNTEIAPLQTSLNQTTAAIQMMDGSINNAITKQTELNDIVSTEKERLAGKKISVDNARDGQKRLILLNDTYRKRYLQYMKILIAIVIVLAIFWGLQALETYITFIPSAIFDLLMIINFVVGLIYIYLVYVDINTRDLIEYDKLSINGPSAKTKSDITAQKDGSDLLKPINACANETCCSEGTTWDEVTGKCIVTKPVTTSVDGFVSNSPSEVNDYKFLS